MFSANFSPRAFELSSRQEQFPFQFNHDKDGRKEPDVYRPNLQYFEFVDRVSEIASEMGITLVSVPSWGRWLNGGLHGAPIIFDTDNAYAYAKFLGNRYPFHPFVLGGDSNRFWNMDAGPLFWDVDGKNNLAGIEIVDYGPVTEVMAKGLIEGEAARIATLSPELQSLCRGYETFLTYHSTQGMTDNTMCRCGHTDGYRMVPRHS